MKQKIIIVLLIAFSLFSCTTTKEQMGSYSSMQGKPQTILVDEEINLFWDIIPLQKIAISKDLTDYEITKRRGLFGTVTYYGTLGIFSWYKVTIKTKPKHETEK